MSSDPLLTHKSFASFGGRYKPAAFLAATRNTVGRTTARSIVQMLNDTLMMVVAFGLAALFRIILLRRTSPRFDYLVDGLDIPSGVYYLSFFVIAFLFVAYRYGLYSGIAASNRARELRLIVQGCLDAGLVLCGLLYVLHAFRISRMQVALLILTASVALCVHRSLLRHFRTLDYQKGIGLRNVAILGTNQLGFALSEYLQKNSWMGYSFVGFIASQEARISPEISRDQIVGNLDEIRSLTRRHFIDEVVVAEFYPTEDVIELVEDARELHIDVRAIAGYYTDLVADAPVEYLGIFPVASLHRRNARTIGLFFKRVVDIALSPLVLVLLAIPMVVIAFAIKLDSEGPILYSSERVGKRGRVFQCLKFRSMIEDADEKKKELDDLNQRDGVLFKLANDPRVTHVGKWLRRYSLDELPQLVNVLRGDMSLVGPRPSLPSEVVKYKLEQLHRLDVMPGMTGLWQVRARQDRSFAKYIALDIAYVENWTFWLDLKILMRTVNVVLRGTGV